jgi:hypothetical protein
MPKALRGPFRKFLKKVMAKSGKPRSERDEDEEDAAENEREDLADLHAEHTGKAPAIEVTDEDLPESLRGDSEEEEADEDLPESLRGDSEEEEAPKKKDSKRSK